MASPSPWVTDSQRNDPLNSNNTIAMAQPPHSQAQGQQPYLAHPPPPAPRILPPLPQHAQPLKQLQSNLNFMMVETGKTMRSAVLRRDPARNMDEHARRAALEADTEKLRLMLAGAIPMFHDALDEMEADIVRAKAVIARDLRIVRGRKNMTAEEKLAEETRAVDQEIAAAVEIMEDVAGSEAAQQRQGGQDDSRVSIDNPHGFSEEFLRNPLGLPQSTLDFNQLLYSGQVGFRYATPPKEKAAKKKAAEEIAAKEKAAEVGQALSRPTSQLQAARTPSAADVRALAILEQQQQQQLGFLQNQRLNQQLQQQQLQQQQQQQQQRQPQPSPHTPAMQTSRTMPEDNIAFNALPGTVPNSPAKANASPIAIPPTASHPMAQQAGLNVPTESLPLLPDHMRSQMAQVHSQAVLEAEGVQPNAIAQVTDQNPDPAFTAHDSPVHVEEQFSQPAFQSQQQSQQQNDPQQSQQGLASPFQPQGQNQRQQQNQSQQQNNKENQPPQQQQPAPQPAHDEIDFGMFDANAEGGEDINFDDFFNDLPAPADNAQGSGTNDSAAGQLSGLDGVNETGAADFDLSTFGMDVDGATADHRLGGMADANVSDVGFGNAMAQSGQVGGGGGLASASGLGGMLEGLESYAMKASDEDGMEGLDFGGDLGMGGLGDGGLGNVQGQGEGQDNDGRGGNNQGFGEGSAQDGAFGAGIATQDGGFGLSNADLDAAMNMSMDQGTTFDDLLDNMDFGGGGGNEGADSSGNAETSEFDDAFFGL